MIVRCYCRLVCSTIVFCFSAVALGDSALPFSADKLYQQKCMNCHGTDGQGVEEKYDESLHGDLSIDELAAYIEESMPPDEPESCQGDEAREIAQFIHAEFYSPGSRLRAEGRLAPRLRLARLTADQYRNAIADLMASFDLNTERRNIRRQGSQAEMGWNGSYYQSDGMNKTDSLRLRRIDEAIDFDFLTHGPTAEILADQFAIIWHSTFEARYTGFYDFRLTTQNGARLYVNSGKAAKDRNLRDDRGNLGQAALVDTWVSSGKLREQEGRIFLLGGRRYPLRVEFFKYKEETASIRVEWKPPHGVWKALDNQTVRADWAPWTYVSKTPFPPDDHSAGYERGVSISRAWHDAIADSAIAAAGEMINRLPDLVGKPKETPPAAYRKLAQRFVSSAYRRPLTSEEISMIDEEIFAKTSSPEQAVHQAVLMALSSPHFLYTDLTPQGRPPTPNAIASRLALAMWDSLPDRTLTQAAESGQLKTKAQIQEQARRMWESPLARQKLRQFFRHWLEMGERDLAKDKARYPEFDAAVAADLRQSLNMFIERVVSSERSDYRELLLADYLFMNEPLEEFYRPGQSISGGSNTPIRRSPDEFAKLTFANEKRAGVLTHPYLLSAFAYHNETSPIHRGVFLTRNVIGRNLAPPPEAIEFNDAAFEPGLTMREKVTQLTRDAACMSCHSVINPLGFALEGFDAVGRWRSGDELERIDTRSEFESGDGATVSLSSARDIAQFAVQSEAAQRAFVVQLFQHLVKQDPEAYSPGLDDELRRHFVEKEFSIREICIAIATYTALYDHSQPPLAGHRHDDQHN